MRFGIAGDTPPVLAETTLARGRRWLRFSFDDANKKTNQCYIKPVSKIRSHNNIVYIEVSGSSKLEKQSPEIRARRNGEQQNLKTNPKTNDQTLGFLVKTRMEYKRRIRETNAKIKNENESTVEMEHQH